MALKATLLFLFSSFLFVTTKVTSNQVEFITEAPAHTPVKAPAHPLVKAPAPSPVKAPAHPPVKAPAHAPEHSHHHAPGKAHHHPPKKAPAHAPEHSHHHAPEKAPHHPPKKAPVPPPSKVPPIHYTVPSMAPTPLEHGCVPACRERCKTHHHEKRRCMRVCTACCDKCKCVPPGTSGNLDKCKNWDYVFLHGKKFECP